MCGPTMLVATRVAPTLRSLQSIEPPHAAQPCWRLGYCAGAHLEGWLVKAGEGLAGSDGLKLCGGHHLGCVGGICRVGGDPAVLDECLAPHAGTLRQTVAARAACRAVVRLLETPRGPGVHHPLHFRLSKAYLLAAACLVAHQLLPVPRSCSPIKLLL